MIYDKYNMDIDKNIFLAKRTLVDSIYQQANLEGIAVTYAQTQDILNNVNVNNLSPNEISKVCCLRDGWKYLFENINSSLDIVFLENLHEIVARFDVDYRYLGKLRQEQVLISGTTWKPGIPDFDSIENLINCCDYSSVTEKAIVTGLRLMRIQPFQDGNKRIGSYVINKILIQKGKGIFNVPVELDGIFKTMLVEFYESNDCIDLANWIYDNCLIGVDEVQADETISSESRRSVRDKIKEITNDSSSSVVNNIGTGIDSGWDSGIDD